MSAVNNLDPCPLPAGPVGPVGPAGALGAIGPAGAAGVNGAMGPAGGDGTPGADGATGAEGPMGAAGAPGASGPAGPTALSADGNNAAVLGADGLLYVPLSFKLGNHLALPIAAVATAGATQPLVNAGQVFEVADTNGLILSFGVDGKLRATARPILARYTKTMMQALSNFIITVVNFEQVDFDPLGLVTPGAGWAFRCPVDGYYQVQANVYLSQGAGPTGNPETGTNLFIYHNGAFYSMLDTFIIEPSGRGPALTGDTGSLTGSDLVRCVAGDTLDLRVRRTNSLLAVYGSAAQAWTHVAISRLQGD